MEWADTDDSQNPNSELNAVCKKFNLRKCQCGEFHKIKHLYRCICGLYYCKKCYSITDNAAAQIKCSMCTDNICARCQSDNCIECGNIICTKESNVRICSIYLCSGCEGRLCCWDRDDTLQCKKCSLIFCTRCMFQHPCKPRINTCGDITYLCDPMYECICGKTACVAHKQMVLNCRAGHSMQQLHLCLNRRKIYLPRELLYYIWEFTAIE